MAEQRVKSKKVDLDEDQVKRFFEGRGTHINEDAPITSVLYQDNNPELALSRDKAEKDKILPKLNISAEHGVIDVGCGIGRWYEGLEGTFSYYLGLDISSSLIAYAKEKYNSENVDFDVLSADKISSNNLKTLGYKSSYDRIISAGLLLYLNDEKVLSTLKGLFEIASDNAVIYLREPIASDDRLTLNQFYSEDLKTEYSAIYRPLDEYLDMFYIAAKNTNCIFKCIDSGKMFDEANLNNRKETYQYYWILQIDKS